MFFYLFRVPWVLIKNLISLYLSIVVAPLQIVIGTLVPSIGFGMWFKKIIAEAMVFPVTGLFLYLAMMTVINSMTVSFAEIGEVFGISDPGSMWAPPIIGSADDMAGLLWLALSFMFIVMIPKAVDIMKMLIMGEKFAFGTAVGEAFGAAKFAYGATIGQPVSMYQQSLAFESISKFLEKKSVHDLLTRIPIIGSKAEEVRDLFRERAKRGGH